VGSPREPVCVALVNDYDVVVVGLAHLLDPYASRVVVAELDTNQPVLDEVEVVLYDTFAQPEADQGDLDVLVNNPQAGHVAVYTWNFHPALVESALGKGAHGCLSKTLPARGLVEAIEAIADGDVVVSETPPRSRPVPRTRLAGTRRRAHRPGSRGHGAHHPGKSNIEIAALMYLSTNTVKTYIRNAYRKIGVTTRRHAILWGVQHGLTPDRSRIEHWRGGP
jgi:DNA-binding NarL/FixJ family response regulator